MFKKIVFFATLFLGAVIVDYFKLQNYCTTYSCRESADGVLLGILISSGVSLLVIILVSLLGQKVFLRWWSFSKYAIPLVFIFSILINSGIHHDPLGQLQNIFDIPALLILYGIFIIGSIIQIIRGCRQK